MPSEQVYRAEAASDLREDFFKIALCLCAYFPITSTIASLFLSAYSSKTPAADPEAITGAFMQSGYYSIYLLAIAIIPLSVCILLYCLITKRRLSLLSLRPTVSGRGLGLFLSLGLGALPISAAAAALWGKALSQFDIAASEVQAPEGVFATAIFILSHVVLAPVLEELIFRSLILERLRRYGDVFAVVTSALLFMLLHASLSSFAYAFVSGIIFGFLAVYTGSFLCPLIIHAVNNLISVIMIILTDRISPESADLIYVGLLIFFAAISVIAAFTIKKKGGFKLTFDGKMIAKSRKASIIFTSLPMLVFIIMAISLALSAV